MQFKIRVSEKCLEVTKCTKTPSNFHQMPIFTLDLNVLLVIHLLFLVCYLRPHDEEMINAKVANTVLQINIKLLAFEFNP